MTKTATLNPFEGLPVTKVGVELPKAAGGLRDALDVDPIELHHGDEGVLSIRYRVQKVRFDPVSKDEPDGNQRRVAVLDVLSAIFDDPEGEVAERLEEQAERVRRAKEAAKGVTRLPTPDELTVQHQEGGHDDEPAAGCPLCLDVAHDAGEHTDLVEGCEQCQAEVDAEAAERASGE